jgi:hypothetical protein
VLGSCEHGTELSGPIKGSMDFVKYGTKYSVQNSMAELYKKIHIPAEETLNLCEQQIETTHKNTVGSSLYFRQDAINKEV